MQPTQGVNGTLNKEMSTEKSNAGRKPLPDVLRGKTAIMFWGSLATFVLTIIILVSPGWASTHYFETVYDTSYEQYYINVIYTGLFVDMCPKREGLTNPDWVKASQALIVLAFLCSIVAFAAATVYLFIDFLNKTYAIYAFTLASIVAAFFMFLGFIVFAAKIEQIYTLGYGFAFAVIDFFVFIGISVGGVMQMKDTGMLPALFRGGIVKAIG